LRRLRQRSCRRRGLKLDGLRSAMGCIDRRLLREVTRDWDILRHTFVLSPQDAQWLLGVFGRDCRQCSKSCRRDSALRNDLGPITVYDCGRDASETVGRAFTRVPTWGARTWLKERYRALPRKCSFIYLGSPNNQ
jgi:hypothetical protein